MLHNEEIIVYASKKRLWLLMFIALIFVVVGILLAVAGMSEKEYTIIIVSVLCLVVFGFCLIYLINKLLSHEPSLIINDEGIFDNSTYVAGGQMLWTEISAFTTYKYNGQLLIGIEFYDSELFLSNQTWFKRALMKLNQNMGLPPVNISPKIFEMPLEDVHGEILMRWERSLENK